MNKEFIEIKVNNEALAKLLDVGPTGIVKVEVRQGIPVDREWRNRLRDAKIDSCISLCNNTAKSSPVTKAKKGSDNASS